LIGAQATDGAPGPIAIGGVGGSGTRVVASVLKECGFFLGNDLNKRYDNLWYTLMFRRRSLAGASTAEIARLADIFVAAMSGTGCTDPEAHELLEQIAGEDREEFKPEWRATRAKSLRKSLLEGKQHESWAWKEPNTHILLDRLAESIPGLRYIHVIRDGRDMAFSANQNQVKFWAEAVFGMDGLDPSAPAGALRYWRLANERIRRLKDDGALPILEVGFECLCEHPARQILAIAEFCGVTVTREGAADIAARTVRAPATIGRFQDMDQFQLDPEDCRYASETVSRLFRALDAHPHLDP